MISQWDSNISVEYIKRGIVMRPHNYKCMREICTYLVSLVGQLAFEFSFSNESTTPTTKSNEDGSLVPEVRELPRGEVVVGQIACHLVLLGYECGFHLPFCMIEKIKVLNLLNFCFYFCLFKYKNMKNS